MTDRIYLDHAATTPVVPAAREAMAEAMANWANPSSPHGDGRKAKAALEDARARVKTALDWDGELIFTSGASEAIGLGLGSFSRAILISDVEHVAVAGAIFGADTIPVGEDGTVGTTFLLSLVELVGKFDRQVRFAIQSANNETGVLQPLDQLLPIIADNGGVSFCDCSQSAGKLPLPDADMIAVSGHKFGGPPGIGALLVRDLGLLKPTGGQEKGYRRGTENLPAAVGFAAALEAGFGWLTEAGRLRARLDAAVSAAGGEVVAHDSPRLATIASYRMPGISASSQLIGFDMAGISVSAGSACSSGTLKASHVLSAMGWDAKAASEVVRVSFGPTTSEADIDRFIAVWSAIKERAQAA